ncbi:MAG TPA: hypothetical protein VMS65_05895, partial [Polyangiaceae bacterium]|nr:hypothetical protein [Polyangiaceae bacterium]
MTLSKTAWFHPPPMSGTGTRSSTSPGHEAGAVEAETVTTDGPDDARETIRALYVTGPHGGA